MKNVNSNCFILVYYIQLHFFSIIAFYQMRYKLILIANDQPTIISFVKQKKLRQFLPTQLWEVMSTFWTGGNSCVPIPLEGFYKIKLISYATAITQMLSTSPHRPHNFTTQSLRPRFIKKNYDYISSRERHLNTFKLN